jgi:hypothetical protein
LKTKIPLSASKFKEHIKKEIQEYLEYTIEINPRSPNKNIQDSIDDIKRKTGNFITIRFSKKWWGYRKLDIHVNLPTEWEQVLENSTD